MNYANPLIKYIEKLWKSSKHLESHGMRKLPKQKIKIKKIEIIVNIISSKQL